MKKLLLVFCGVLLVGGIWLAPPAQAGVPTFTNAQINHKGQVVWRGNDGSNPDIFLFKGFGQPLNISQNDLDNRFPQINYRGQVVWEGWDGSDPDTYEIYLYKGYGEPIQLTNNDYPDRAPQINSKGWVVWYGGPSDDEREIFLYKGYV